MNKNIIKVIFISTSFLFLTSSASALTCTNLTKPLSKGSENSGALTLQQFLYDAGYLLVKPNGYFGENTRKAVSAFQKKENISITGTAGPLTRAKIKEISCTLGTASPEVKNVTSPAVTNEEGKVISVPKNTPIATATQQIQKSAPVTIVVEEIPTIYVKTFLAVDITSDTAVLKQTGGIDGEKHWFEWGTTMDMKNVTPQTVASTTYSYKLTGLLPSTAYYFRAVTNVASSTDRKAETAYGDMRYFTTPTTTAVAQALPTVSISSTGVAVNSSGSTKITWTSTGTTLCSFTDGEEGGDWTNQRPLSGQYITRPITRSTVFSISCRNNAGYTVTGSVTVATITN